MAGRNYMAMKAQPRITNFDPTTERARAAWTTAGALEPVGG
jgi:hypothetical protein